jgi:hypothetical protein
VQNSIEVIKASIRQLSIDDQPTARSGPIDCVTDRARIVTPAQFALHRTSTSLTVPDRGNSDRDLNRKRQDKLQYDPYNALQPCR